MRRVMKWLGIGAAGLLGVLVLAVALIWVGANTGPGRAFVTRLVPRFTGGTVHISGLSGRLPGHIRASRVVLSDASGPWLTARDVVLDWRPLSLFGGTIVVDRLSAPEADFLRLPSEQSETTQVSSAQAKKPSKPSPLIVHELAVQRLVVSSAVAGHAIDLALTASGERTSGGVEALKVDAEALGKGGVYRIDGKLTPERVALTADLAEPAGGMMAGLMGLSVAGPIRLKTRLDGPRSAIAVDLAATAGRLVAHASGDIDLATHSANIAISAHAPAMQPRPGISWRSATLNARLDGPFATPRLDGAFDLADLSAAGARISQIMAKLSGSRGAARLEATLSGIVLPGPAPELLAKAPVRFDASAKLDAPGRPVAFTLEHPLITIEGNGETAGAPRLTAAIDLPNLAPFAAIAGFAVSGSAITKLSAHEENSGAALALSSTLNLLNAPAPVFSLVGAQPRIFLSGGLHGDAVTVTDLSLVGRAVSLKAHGDLSAAKVALAWQATLSDLTSLDTQLKGHVSAKGTLEGPSHALALAAELGGTLGTAEFAPQPFQANITAAGLPAAPSATLTAEASLDGAPLVLDLKAAQSAGTTFAVTVDQAHWKSLQAQGAMTVGTAAMPLGEITFSAGRLADLSPLLATSLAGSAKGSLRSEESDAGPVLALDLRGENLAAAGARIAHADLAAKLRDPLAQQNIDATVRLAGLSTGGMNANATISARGPLDALALDLKANSASFGEARLSAAALINATAGSASLSRLAADWHGEVVRLLAPARITFSPDIAVERLRLGVAGAEFDASGAISPGLPSRKARWEPATLALNLALHNVTPALLTPVLPGLAMKGRLDAEAKLAGALAAPTGILQVRATNLGVSSGMGAGLPPASFDLTAQLSGRAAQIRGALAAGSGTRLSLSGDAPLTGQGPLDLSINGAADLGLLEPALAAGGRRIGGRLALDASVHGTLARPAIDGTARLSGGMISDYQSGLALTAMAGNFTMQGDTLRIQDFTAHAGPGTIRLAGSVGILDTGIPVSLSVNADNAELLQSDLITVRLDSDLALTGAAEHELTVRGNVHIRRADIRIPNSMPPNIAVLHVVRPGSKPTAPQANAPAVALDITLDAPRQLFVRGRGVDAEFGGRIHVSGTIAAPLPEGSFQLIRGQVSLAGQTLAFTSGTIGFNGGNPADPTLDLVATSATRTATATLTLGGTVQQPKVTLSSVPELPQDQVLAALLFGGSGISPFQMAEIASSLASLTGAGPGIGDPLGAVRKGLGLDQLTVGSDASGNAALQAGRYIAPGVYVGASQSAAGGGAQAQVKIDLTKHLKLEATTGNGGASATAIGSATDQPTTRNGTSVGLTYQFEY